MSIRMMLLIVVTSACATIHFPYIGDLSPEQVCGEATSKCQPQQVPKFVLEEKAEFAWNGDPKQIIGYMFKSGHELNLLDKCYDPAETTHYNASSFTFKAGLTKSSVATFSAKVQSILDQALQAAVNDHAAQASVSAGLSAAVNKALKSDANIKYTIYSPVPSLYSADGFKNCLQKLTPGTEVITGIAVVEISNQSFNASVDYQLDLDVGAQAKAAIAKSSNALDAEVKWTQMKNLAITDGLLANWRFVYAIGYTDRAVY